MAELKNIFDALMMEAHSDIRSAKLLLDGAEFSSSIYHSQQAVEKAMKANLALTGAIITDDHWVSDLFKQVFPEKISSREYNEYDESDAYKKANTILKIINQFLREKHSISFEVE